MSEPSKIVTRFAPSPTGPLHIGGARTALFNYFYARRHKGTFLLRIEDTDRERSTQEYEQAILEALDWLGAPWEGEPLYQSQRTKDYQEATERLLSEGKAYRDYTPAAEVDRLREEAQAKKEPFRFREEMARKEPTHKDDSFVVRFRFPREGKVGFHDDILGDLEAPAEQFDDFVILRPDGTPVFHLCNVLDDIHQGVTHVIRGNDHQTNTFKHVALYAALAKTPPAYGHVPLIAGPDGRKLSKREMARAVLEYRDEGYLPEALVNFLVRIGWSHGDQEVFSREELCEKFDLSGVGKSMGAFNPEKLLWINQQWMKASSDERLAALMHEYLRKEPGISIEVDDRLVSIARVQKERNQTVREMAEASWYFFRRPVEYDPKAKEKFLGGESAALLKDYEALLKAQSAFEAVALEAVTNRFLEERQLKLKHIAQPLRVALTGGTVSPGIYDVLEILGKEESLARINAAIGV